MSDSEIRTPLEQPEGHVGVQVDWLEHGELLSAQILSRDPRSTAYLNVHFPGSDQSDNDSEEELIYSTPRLVVGWETDLDARGVIEKVREVMPDRFVKDYFCVPPTEDEVYFTTDDNPYYTSSVEEVLKKERSELGIHFLNPNGHISWEYEADNELSGLYFMYHTLHSLKMEEDLIRNLMEHTATPEKREAIIAALEPLKSFYANYVEIDFHQ